MQLRKQGLSWRSARDWMIARFIRVSAWLSIALMFLILVFIAKESLALTFTLNALAVAIRARMRVAQRSV